MQFAAFFIMLRVFVQLLELGVGEFFIDYGLFFLKAATIVAAILIVFMAIITLRAARHKGASNAGSIEVELINERIDGYRDDLRATLHDNAFLSAEAKLKKQQKKSKQKSDKKKAKSLLKNKDSEGLDAVIDETDKKRVFVLDFDGDIKASAVDFMREEITAILTVAKPSDEVIVRLESGGGMVHSYGLAAAQLQRIRNHKIPLSICIDKVAASGGYMMACVGDKIIAAPFAIIGSIGVVAQLPNFHRLLKKNDIDFELYTAGEYKRTLTMLGENTDAGRAKFKQELEETHDLFKDFVGNNRAVLDVESVANGDVWYGTQALANKLIDALGTSDDYIKSCTETADVYQVAYVQKQSFTERLGLLVETGIERAATKAISQLFKTRFF